MFPPAYLFRIVVYNLFNKLIDGGGIQLLYLRVQMEQEEILQLSAALEKEIAEESEQVSDVGRFLQLADFILCR